MTVISVHHPEGRITLAQRTSLATSLTDAVLEVECGQVLAAARAGFQVHFRAFPVDHMAIGGRLLSDVSLDIMAIDIAVMDGAWPARDRRAVIDKVFEALCKGLGMATPSPTWWINVRVIDEGSWGSRGGVLSILDLLPTGAFTATRAEEIRRAINRREP
jgi:phenylpyruvate tautomerase PptA (4-oxalocrotonate tautomerase family)